jgi:hypothetical protein
MQKFSCVYHRYGWLDFKSWAILFSLTTQNLAVQLGPFRLYIGWNDRF